MKTTKAILLLCLTPFLIKGGNQIEQTDLLIKDEKTAIQIAKTIWKPLYGKLINKSKPFVASLKNDSIWVVKGTLPKGRKGGVPYIEFNAFSCQVYEIHHGK